MRAVILAAGSGERLIQEGLRVAKPLIEVGGLPMLERTIRAALRAGASQCLVVLGARARDVQAALDPRLKSLPVRWVLNENWESGNGASVLAVRPLIEPGERFLILMADHLIFAPTLARLLASPPADGRSVMAVDFKKGLLIDPDDATKVRISGSRITELDKKLATFDAIDTGASLCTPAVFDEVEKGTDARGGCSHAGGMRGLAGRGELLWHDIGADRWEDVDSLGARRAAESMLYDSLRKSTDGFLSRHLERHLSLAVTRVLVKTPVTPNMVTAALVALGALAALLFAQPGRAHQVAGALLFWTASFLDGCDGELARLKFMESRLGGWMDLWADNVVHIMVFIAMGVGLGRATGETHWPWLGAAAAAGVLFSVSWVSLTVLRKKKTDGPFFTSVTGEDAERSPLARRLAGWADALSRRDFVFFVIFLALLGLLPYFLWAAAVGSHLYWIVLVAIHMSRPDSTT